MNNSVVSYQSEDFGVMQNMAKMMVDSGFFNDVKQVAQAMVKIQAGREIGLPPFAAMSGIHIVQGKPVLGANLIATLVKNDPRYDYRVKVADNNQCVLTWYEGGQPVGESSFTMTEANAAGLTNKPTWKAYASDMLFARALTRGARRYAPGIFGGAPIYTPEELNVETDEDGHVIQGEIVNVTPPAPSPAPPPTAAPMPDDELVITEASAKEFPAAAAALLNTDTEDLKARMRALGYTSIPGKPAERVAAYRKLRDVQPTQPALVTDDPNAAQAAADTAAGNGGYQE
jgi:hypothetical protein